MTAPTIFPLSDRQAAGQELEQAVRACGCALADGFGRLLEALPGAPLGPQKLATLLGTTIVNTSRLLKATGCADPIAVIYHLPGPDPLRRLIQAAGKKGVESAIVADAQAAVARFDQLIADEGGDRGSFDAIVSAWLPAERSKFEARRRQSAFKALSELKGCSSGIELASLFVWPSTDAERLDVACVQGIYGLTRIRPDVRVKFGTRRLSHVDDPRICTNLDGVPAGDGLATVRLDAFCQAPPGPLDAHAYGKNVLYTLGDTGFGPRSAVDIILGEVNRSELARQPEPSQRRFFFHIVATPARKVHFDLFVHAEYTPGEPELIVYDTTGEGPANPNDRVRDVDCLEVSEGIEILEPGPDALRGTGVPRYAELIGTACEKLGLDVTKLRGYRVRMDHPLVGMQICLAFPRVEG